MASLHSSGALAGSTLPWVESTMNYLAPMSGTPYVDVFDPAQTRVAVETHRVRFHDMRPAVASLSLDREGFRLLKHQTTVRDFSEAALVENVYLREMERVVAAATGADRVVSALGPVLRLNAAGTRNEVRPAALAHTDYTAKTLSTQIGFQLDLASPEWSRYRKIVAYQTWRALSPPPQDSTLAFCDARSVSPADRVRSEFLVQEPRKALLEFYMYRHNPTHRWCYFANLEPTELLLFKGFEGDAETCANVIHGAFTNPACPPGTTPRRSIETRAFAFFTH